MSRHYSRATCTSGRLQKSILDVRHDGVCPPVLRDFSPSLSCQGTAFREPSKRQRFPASRNNALFSHNSSRRNPSILRVFLLLLPESRSSRNTHQNAVESGLSGTRHADCSVPLFFATYYVVLEAGEEDRRRKPTMATRCRRQLKSLKATAWLTIPRGWSVGRISSMRE